MKIYRTTTSLLLALAAVVYLTMSNARQVLEERAREDRGSVSIEAAVIAAALILLAGLLVVKLTGAFEARSDGIK
ncbi:hypothetical protein M3697_12475 [Janibacter melonis]|uniref:hypothetical protein n=1 Tax=Janibacter melonis TaxID=262209 RepID=UPI002043DCC2|nr:hypothetical protein [Janibacter melonis]MCM3555912.1 hypothetical protein [Janibacter melonis]